VRSISEADINLPLTRRDGLVCASLMDALSSLSQNQSYCTPESYPEVDTTMGVATLKEIQQYTLTLVLP
jgi:hypothetical protein